MTIPHHATPVGPWWTCPTCGAMWRSFAEEPCWACDGEPRKSFSPSITSQYGYRPPDSREG